jgi:hypothetical protein
VKTRGDICTDGRSQPSVIKDDDDEECSKEVNDDDDEHSLRS